MSGDRRRHYDDDFMRVVAGLIRDGAGRGLLARRLGVPYSTARKWVLSYRFGGEAALMGERKGNKVYDYETKLSAVLDHVEHGLTKAEVMARYGIASLAPLERWCREYRTGGADALRPRPKGRPKGAKSKPKPSPTREQLLEEENAYLRARVAYLEKARALPASRSPTGTSR
ncbi:helix-turn-helix domain-containing protein [Bifidobacterium simiiventris]|uniref:helix-turn-helix domain-containing protein n=1 Tax=Bifidobacterium simiiventris TaxID=2834434 RepID=UPI001C579A74|nr:helix-turn-helix domain-containing protein [Bifidobacterium simiiventris]MBW3078482.1 transposase [Bifidobacterium simiiventris]